MKPGNRNKAKGDPKKGTVKGAIQFAVNPKKAVVKEVVKKMKKSTGGIARKKAMDGGMQKDGNAAARREPMQYGGMGKKKMMGGGMSRTMLKDGGMPKAMPN